MRTLALLAPLCGVALATGCSGGSPAAPAHGPASTPSLTPTYSFNPGGESLVAQFRLAIDPATLSATVEPITGRSGQAQPPQALSYDLDIANFLRPDSFEVTAVTKDTADDLVVSFIHRHPFRAPDFSLPITGQNRADLGYTGRLMVLAQSTTQSFFGNITTDPTVVKNPDGYARPGDLLAEQGLVNNTFPYILLVDEAEDNRIIAAEGSGTPVSNAGSPSGSYDPSIGGWQRANIGSGTAGTGWTGYDYLHSGQGVVNSFSLYSAALAGGPVSLDVA
ncbi:MAG TPA: hypothetical protein VEI97_03190, partial [bacterium]|nr:hypothetical protein [bacterium]